MGDSAPQAADQPFKLETFSTLLRWVLAISPVTSALYFVGYLRQPDLPLLLAAGSTGAMTGVAWWCRSRTRAGELLRPARVFIVALFVVLVRFLLYPESAPKIAGGVGIALTVLLATALDEPRFTYRWVGVGMGFYALGNLLAVAVPIPMALQGRPGVIAMHVIAAVELLLVALLGRTATRHLRLALRRSEHTRRQLDLRNKELQSFAHVVSHDLRAPLRALANYSRFLKEDCAPELSAQSLEYVEGIADSAKHMDALVLGLLEYARVGSVEVPSERVETRDVLAHVVNALRLRDVADVTLPADAPAVWARPVRLEQIFRNLLDNAVKFRRSGVRPSVAVEWADRQEAWEFAVRDNGIGIAARDVEKLFGMFQRLHTASEYEGTGIGLAVVKKAVEEHGGKIWVESRPGEGSTFRFTLPKPPPASSPTSELAATG